MKTNKKTCEVAIHFNRTPHVLSDFAFQCIDQIQTDMSENTEKLLITKEAYWSAQLFSLSPFHIFWLLEEYVKSFYRFLQRFNSRQSREMIIRYQFI